MPPPPLKAITMRADRTRYGIVSLAVLVVFIPLAIFLSLPMADAAFSFIGTLLLAAAHRTIFIRLSPPFPSSSALSLVEVVQTQLTMRCVGAIAVGSVALIVSLCFHSVPLRSCQQAPVPVPDDSAAAACASPTSSYEAAFAALVGLMIGIEYVLIAGGEDRASPWPLVAQTPFIRLRRVLPIAMAKAARIDAQCTIALVFLAYLAPGLVFRNGRAILGAVGSCAPCTATASSVPLVPGLRALISLVLRGWAFCLYSEFSLEAVRVAYTLPLDFRLATVEAGDTDAAAAEMALFSALAKASPPLTQHLAFYDAATLAQHDPPRRRALFDLDRGAAWAKFLKLLVAPLDATSAALDAGRKRRGGPPKLPHVPLVPKWLVGRVQATRAAFLDQTARARILGSSQLVSWASDALSCLIAASVTEDTLGAVQSAQSLGVALTALLRCLHALESFMAGGGGGVRGGVAATTSRRSQQLMALRVALGPPAPGRAAGAAQHAVALEVALSRALYLLVHTFGSRVVLAANVPPELRARLEAFVGEAF